MKIIHRGGKIIWKNSSNEEPRRNAPSLLWGDGSSGLFLPREEAQARDGTLGKEDRGLSRLDSLGAEECWALRGGNRNPWTGGWILSSERLRV